MSCLGPSYLPQPARAWTRFQPRCPDELDIKALKINEDNILGANEKIPLSVKYRMPQYKKGNILQYKANSANLTKRQIYALMARGKWTNRNVTWATQSVTYTNPNTQSLLRVNSDYAIINTSNDPTISDTEFININCPPQPTKKTSKPLPPNASETQDPGDNPDVPPQPDEPSPGNPTIPKYVEVTNDTKEYVVEDGGELLCNTKEDPCTGEVYTGPFKDDCFPTTDSDVPGSIEFLCWNNALNTYYPRNKTTYATSGNKWPYNYKGFQCGNISADSAPVLYYQPTIPYSSEIILSWVFNDVTALSGVTHIVVYENNNSIERLPPSERTTTIDGLITGVKYSFFIRSDKIVVCEGNKSNTVDYFISFPTFLLSVSISVGSSSGSTKSTILNPEDIQIRNTSFMKVGNSKNIFLPTTSSIYTTLTWYQDSEGGAISGYKLYMNNRLLTTITNPDITTYDDVTTIFISAQTYYYSMSSYSPMSVSLPSPLFPVFIPFPLYEINQHVFDYNVNPIHVTIYWEETHAGGLIDKYDIYRNDVYIASVINSNQYTDTSILKAGETYTYKLKTIAGSKESDFSAEYNVSIPYPEYTITSTIPSDLTTNEYIITVQWELTKNGGKIYNLDLVGTSQGTITATDITTYIDRGCFAGIDYIYSLETKNTTVSISSTSQNAPFPSLDLVNSGSPVIEPQKQSITVTDYDTSVIEVEQFKGWDMTVQGTAMGGGTGYTYLTSNDKQKPYSGGGGGGAAIDFLWDNEGNTDTNEQNYLTYQITMGNILLNFYTYDDTSLYEITLKPGDSSTDYPSSTSTSTGGAGGEYETSGSDGDIGIIPDTDIHSGHDGDDGKFVITNGFAPPQYPKGGDAGFTYDNYGKGNNGTSGPGSYPPENQYLKITYTTNDDYTTEYNTNIIMLTWSIGTNGGKINGYKIYQNDGININLVANVNSETFTYTTNDLTSGTQYTFYVTSYNNYAESGPSNMVTYTPS
jgi:hypothetical protein